MVNEISTSSKNNQVPDLIGIPLKGRDISKV